MNYERFTSGTFVSRIEVGQTNSLLSVFTGQILACHEHV